MSLNHYSAGHIFLSQPSHLPCLGPPATRTLGLHSFSLGVTGKSGGAKEFAPHGHLELLTLQGKGPPHEGPPLRTGLPGRSRSEPKERGPDGDQLLSRLESPSVIPYHEFNYASKKDTTHILNCFLKALLGNTDYPGPSLPSPEDGAMDRGRHGRRVK